MGGAGRLFVAARIPDAARAEITRAVRAGEGVSVLPRRLVPPANWHMTLRFLGDASDAELHALIESLAIVAARAPVAVELAGWGAFPRPARASVIWLGAGRGAEELAALAADAEAAAVRAGFEADPRPFRPHLTLARFRQPVDVRSQLAALPDVSIGFTVREVALFRSHLGAGPPRYEPVAGFALDGP